MERPCIGICRYDETVGWCLGCGMTKREKKAWKREPTFQPVIAAALPDRLAALGAAGRAAGKEAKKT